MTWQQERQARRAALALVQAMGSVLFDGAHYPIATAMVFFHRFFTRQSMLQHAPIVRPPPRFLCLSCAHVWWAGDGSGVPVPRRQG